MIYPVIFAAALVQAAAADTLFGGAVKPDLLLVLVVFAALFCGLTKAVKLGALAGFLKDALSVGPFINTPGFMLCAVLASLVFGRFYKERLFNQMLAVFACSAVMAGLNLLIFFAQDAPVSAWRIFANTAAFSVIYTTAVVPLVFPAAYRLLARRGRCA